MENNIIIVQELINSFKSINLENIINSITKYQDKISNIHIPEDKAFAVNLEDFQSSENDIYKELLNLVNPINKIKTITFKDFEDYFNVRTKDFLSNNKDNSIELLDYHYYGNLKDGIKEGLGLYLEKSYKYFGKWKDNKEYGEGSILNYEPYKEFFSGHFQEADGKYEFKGFSIIFNDSSIKVFHGDLTNRGEHSKGVYVTYSLDDCSIKMYQGEQINYAKEGDGIELALNDIKNKEEFEVYKGHYISNKKRGIFKAYKYDHYLLSVNFIDELTIQTTDELNILKFKDQTTSSSSYFYGRIHINRKEDGKLVVSVQKGIYYYNNHSIYKGFFESQHGISVKNEKGEFYSIKDNHMCKYEGNFINDELNNGKLFCIEKDKKLLFDGDFLHNMLDNGVYYYNNGIYSGSFKNNLREGHGKYTYNNNEIYEGKWKNNLKEGKGNYQKHPKGPFILFEWKDDKIIK